MGVVGTRHICDRRCRGARRIKMGSGRVYSGLLSGGNPRCPLLTFAPKKVGVSATCRRSTRRLPRHARPRLPIPDVKARMPAQPPSPTTRHLWSPLRGDICMMRAAQCRMRAQEAADGKNGHVSEEVQCTFFDIRCRRMVHESRTR